MESYQMTVGPEGYLPPSVSERGVISLSKGEGLVMGKRVSEQLAIDEAARRLVQAGNPTMFPRGSSSDRASLCQRSVGTWLCAV